MPSVGLTGHPEKLRFCLYMVLKATFGLIQLQEISQGFSWQCASPCSNPNHPHVLPSNPALLAKLIKRQLGYLKNELAAAARDGSFRSTEGTTLLSRISGVGFLVSKKAWKKQNLEEPERPQHLNTSCYQKTVFKKRWKIPF